MIRKFLFICFSLFATCRIYSQNKNSTDADPNILFAHLGFEQQTYGFIISDIGYSINNSGYTSTMHSLWLGYSPWKNLSQFAYEFDSSLSGIGLGAKTGAITNWKNVSFFICPEVGLNLVVAKIYFGYNIPLYSSGDYKFKGIVINARIGLQLTHRDY